MSIPSYLIYDEELQAWGTQSYTLEELRSMPELSENTHVSTADGKRACKLGELLNPSDDKPVFRPGMKTPRNSAPLPAMGNKEREKAIAYLLEQTDLRRLIKVTADYVALLYWLSVIVVVIGLASVVLALLG